MNFKKTLLATALLAFGGFALNVSAADNPSNTKTATFDVKMTINSACTVSTTGDIDFGSVDANANADQKQQASNIQVTCSKGTPYTIGLSTATGSDGVGTMTTQGVDGDSIPYALYQDAGYGTAWGDTVDNRMVGTTHDTGNDAKDYTVYAKVDSAALNVTPGTYNDTVTVNVRY